MSKKVKIEFWQKVKSEIEITVSDEDYNLIKGLKMDTVEMYNYKEGNLILNKAYQVLENYRDLSYVTDCSEELEDVFVSNILGK